MAAILINRLFTMDVLLLGCGKVRRRNVRFKGGATDFSDDNLTTVDIDPASSPDIIFDLNQIVSGYSPFKDEQFDEIHAYDVLEHIGTQGDWRGFFTEFAEYHRILKPGGKMFILVPIGDDAYNDPGHARFFSKSHFLFLSQLFYKQEQDNATTATDYRWYWKKDFYPSYLEQIENHHIAAILEKR